MDATEPNGYAIKPHPAYSPNTRRRNFWSDGEINKAGEKRVNANSPEFFYSEMMALEHLVQCIMLEGNCTEKEERNRNTVGRLLIVSPLYLTLIIYAHCIISHKNPRIYS